MNPTIQNGSVQDVAVKVNTVLTARHAALLPEEIAVLAEESLPNTDAALQLLVAEGRVVRLPDGRFLSQVAAGRLIDTARRFLATYHRRNPLQKGMPSKELTVALAKAADCPDPDAVLAYLAQREVIVRESGPSRKTIRLPDHAVALPPSWVGPANEILEVYRGAGLNPPFPGNFQAHLPRDIRVESILTVLADRGDLVRLADGLYLSAETVAELKQAVLRLAAESGTLTAADLRDAVGSSRRIIVPLLEYFDACGLTKRVGDSRVLNE